MSGRALSRRAKAKSEQPDGAKDLFSAANVWEQIWVMAGGRVVDPPPCRNQQYRDTGRTTVSPKTVQDWKSRGEERRLLRPLYYSSTPSQWFFLNWQLWDRPLSVFVQFLSGSAVYPSGTRILVSPISLRKTSNQISMCQARLSIMASGHRPK